MKRLILLSCVFLFTGYFAFSQTTEFSDDFESGTAEWVLEGAWGVTTAQSNSPSNSLTDSPGGNYIADQNISATMATGVDLSAVIDAELNFWMIYDIEDGNFDYLYVEASGDGGATWTELDNIFGQGNLSPWLEYNYSLGGFVGSSDVKVRFRFFSDGGAEFDGAYIDDVEIISSDVDNSAPLILHTPPAFYESNLGDVNMIADLVDFSGIATAELKYTVDAGAEQTIAGVNVSGDTWSFVIPEQMPGAQVDYFLDVTDASVGANNAMTDVYSYIAGNHVFYDNGVVDFINTFGPGAASGFTGCAVRMTLDGTADVVYALIRNYTDIDSPNDDIEFHVWADDNGLPGTDMITPFMVTPEANLVETSPMTRVDLSAYSAELSSLTGDFFVGFMVPSGEANLTQTTPATANRSFVFNGTTWAANADDYHFRVVTSAFEAPDSCSNAANLTSLLGQGPGNAQTSAMWDNTDATVNPNDPTDGMDCWDDMTLDNPLWYTFEGDGGTYEITTTDCNGTATNYITDGDTQIAIYSGDDCGNLTPVACNEDGGINPDIYASLVELETTAGTTYFMMIDGWEAAAGEFCVQMTEIAVITCDDITTGTATGEAHVCFGETTSFVINDVVIPTIPFAAFNWAITTEDITGSMDPYNEASLVGTFGLSDVAYAPAILNDGTQVPPGTYFFSPIAFGGAVDVTGYLSGLDFTNGCVEVGQSIEVTLYPQLDDLASTPSAVDEMVPPGNNGEASVSVTGGSGNYTYDWSNGGDTESITGLPAGTYTVTITDVSGCVAEVVETIVVDVITGTRDLAFEQAIQLYPNPAKSMTSIVYNFNETVNLTMTMTNTIGQVVEQRIINDASNGSVDINLDKLSEGVYFIQLTDGTRLSSKRLVVTK